jgi:integrase/recombinase XerD
MTDGRLATLFVRYMEHRRRRAFSLDTIKATEGPVSRAIAFLASRGVVEVREVKEAHLAAFVRHIWTSARTGGSLSPNSLASYTAQLKLFFAFAENEGLILRNPALELRTPAVIRLPRALTESEVRRLIETPWTASALGLRDRAVLELLYGTGIRIGECVRLDLQDLNPSQGTLLVRNGKGQKDRVVPFTGRAVTAVEAYLVDARWEFLRGKRSPAVFLSRGGGRMARIAIGCMIARRGREARLGRVTAHMLRHSCATHLLEGGASVVHVQRLLGHASINTTAIYTRVSTQELRRVFRRSHPRDRDRRILRILRSASKPAKIGPWRP